MLLPRKTSRISNRSRQGIYSLILPKSFVKSKIFGEILGPFLYDEFISLIFGLLFCSKLLSGLEKRLEVDDIFPFLYYST